MSVNFYVNIQKRFVLYKLQKYLAIFIEFCFFCISWSWNVSFAVSAPSLHIIADISALTLLAPLTNSICALPILKKKRLFKLFGLTCDINISLKQLMISYVQRTWKRKSLTLFIASIAPQSSIYCFKSLSKYSNTNVRALSVWTMSCRVTAITKV